MNGSAPSVRVVSPGGVLRALREAGELVLRAYAGCLFSNSLWVGALMLGLTALHPFACLLGLLAIGSAVATAHGLGLVSENDVPTVYTYNALFVGLGASFVFAAPHAAVLFAIVGAAACALLTASVRSFTLRAGLPSLSLPFVIVFSCALGCGRALGLSWATPAAISSNPYAAWLPEHLRWFFEALGAIVFQPRAEVGALVLLALMLNSPHAALLATLGYAVAMITGFGVFELPPGLLVQAALNAVFAALCLGMGWFTPSLRSYGLAALGALLCVLITPSLSAPFERLELIPLSLPFNLSIYAVLLIGQLQQANLPRAEQGPDRRLLGG
jgi:urea transporter